ncbi:unnamed protein product [Rotaria magnacalcarata]|uniref:Uncharacterized protein n=3 Tax=Rotaria magnacalcarata TaxID=392030 RepID=A0A816QA85_9BILA|nr:unnamed protein product [Rotaria magnacalcarata]CAF2076612.1 unnamed protein product [Rotaria magnacalcarata]CAF2179819.1 unnamed protein product [Rotaria magnacalcarata]CAF3764274.1 unnamed protein product [Rotaria magnacalcarata]CAF3836877.1 unnamed protein product [Rotaria magnacalcarata]
MHSSFITKPDTWAACDGLGRILPTYDQVGDLRPDKFIGIFYFLWAENEAGFKTGPYDVTKILAAAGGNLINATWGPLYGFHHWSQPYFNYYLMDDEFVIRKHAQMLADAGVDTLILDATNAFTYDNIWSKIANIYIDMRLKSIRTPKFCFITWSSSEQTVRKLYENLYSQNLYRDLWFFWNDKPLILANPDGFPSDLLNFFTIRESWAWTKGQAWFGDGRNKWPWIDNYPQGRGLNESGQLEQTCVTVAGHPVMNIGRSFDGPTQHEPDQINPMIGTYFSQQWEQALKIDPSFIFVTGWNEWIAQRFVQTSSTNSFIGKQWPIGTTFFVDEFIQEYSRDIEPMFGGHGDNYYYQLISYIRRFKGMTRPDLPSGPQTILINQDFTQWNNITPYYLDDIFDIPYRNHPRYGDHGEQVIDYSQRNDLERMQIARDTMNLYFYLRCYGPWIDENRFNWLFLNVDNNYSTGWIGFDYLVDLGENQLKKNIDNTSNWQYEETIKIVNSGYNELHFALSYPSLKINNTKINLQFKWLSADVLYTFDPLNFIDKGDSAPNGRFTYTYMI